MLSSITLIAFLIGCAGAVVSFAFLALSFLMGSSKKKLAAKLVGGFVGLAILGIVVQAATYEEPEEEKYQYTSSEEANNTEDTETDIEETVDTEEDTEEDTKEVEEETKTEPSPSPEVSKRKESIGTSNKDINEIRLTGPNPVRNDVTGNWKYARLFTTEDLNEYAKSYYEEYFEDDDEIHGIVNFSTKTTTKIATLSSNILSVTVHEYVENEEYDAKTMYSGNILKEYFVYLDNGDIEKVR
ncbi:hypothetical protein lbkm_0620 [Lachnospiraceae bacterium KM106-2]|nr:hypothetical protein lbkm_0620 [Lachnospiraceae bacterium KM106-2]